MSTTAKPAPRFHVVEAGPEHAEGVAALFDRAECPCYCRWWHFAGDKNAWGDRCANAPEQSRRELLAAFASGSDEASGMVALTDAAGEADAAITVGWMKLAPAASLSKLYAQRLYRNLPCFAGDRAGVLAIGCFLVDPAWRRSGVARALVEGGVDAARRRGAPAIEAFPRRADIMTPEEMWTGPVATLLECGFTVVSDFAPYPVLRRAAATAAAADRDQAEPGSAAPDKRIV